MRALKRFADWTGRPLGHWFAKIGKPITTESLWAEEFERRANAADQR